MNKWIWKDNLEAFLTVLAWVAEYDPAADEFEVIRRGVESTNAEQDLWYDFEFAGANHIAFSLATDPGTSVLHVKVDCIERSKCPIATAIEIFSHFRVSPST